ncbi:hypothetical protein [Microcystis phage vB_MweS-yong2]|nr:hypothetical protein [Microcystis phage vB_MweS-yong2]
MDAGEKIEALRQELRDELRTANAVLVAQTLTLRVLLRRAALEAGDFAREMDALERRALDAMDNGEMAAFDGVPPDVEAVRAEVRFIFAQARRITP